MNLRKLLFTTASLILGSIPSFGEGSPDEIVLANFSKASESLWQLNSGPNIDRVATFGGSFDLDESTEKGIVLQFKQIAPVTEENKNANWFKLSRDISAQDDWSETRGIKLSLALDQDRAWWLKFTVESEGQSYSQTLQPYHYQTGSLNERFVPFEDFKSSSKKSLNPANITKITLTGSAPNGTFLLHQISLPKKPAPQAKVEFRTGNSTTGMWEPNQPVLLTFTPQNAPPNKAKDLQFEISDYFGETVENGKIALGENSVYQTTVQPELPGFYDVKAYWTDSEGERLYSESCILAEGSRPDGRGTFAIMPNTLEENFARMQELGENAFFGFHGSRVLGDYLGMTWTLSSPRWRNQERDGPPQRSEGRASWVTEAIAQRNPTQDWRPDILNLQLNLNGRLPKWATIENPQEAPGLKDPEEFYRYFTDRIDLQKELYPNMTPRIYDILWEANLNQPDVGIHDPDYYPEDIIEAYRKARQTLDAADPGAMLIGPNCSSPVKNFDWNLPLLELGLLDYIDAYHCHGYHSPTPEENQVVEKFRRLKKTLREFNNGEPVDIYVSELGYRSQYGTEDRHKEHAQWHVRVATILKGEGIKVYFPFYGYDYRDSNKTWGICYNLEPTLKFGPEYISPKATAPALAVCVNELEGTTPIAQLPYFGNDVWCYTFEDNATGEPMAVLWSVNNEHQIQFPAGDTESLKITNIMGHKSETAVEDGLATLNISPSPIYVRGISSTIYNPENAPEQPILGEAYPGEEVSIQLENLSSREFAYFGDAQMEISSQGTNILTVSVPENAAVGAIPVLFDGESQMGWITIREPLKASAVHLEVVNGEPVLNLEIENLGAIDLESKIELSINGTRTDKQAVNLPKRSASEIQLSVGDQKIDSPLPFLAQLSISVPNLSEIQIEKKLSFLSAYPREESGSKSLPHSVTWSGPGQSGETDQATAYFAWDENYLYLTVDVEDDIFHQTRPNGSLWKMDSLQVAFDTHPELREIYDPLAGIFTKKISELTVGLSDDQTQVWRDRTFNQDILPVGDITDKIRSEVSRDSAVTRYKLAIPWEQIGLEDPSADKPIGISILINDSDNKPGGRAGLELFGGIMRGKDFNQYGIITLAD